MKKILLFITILLVSRSLIAASPVTGSVDFSLSLDVIKADPVCKLNATSTTIDFGDIDPINIFANPAYGVAHFRFVDCENVNSVDISFSSPNIDEQNNYVRNTTGTDKASGIAIKLHNDAGREMNLMEKFNLIVNSAQSANLFINARVITTDPYNGFGVKPGIIDTSVALEITYN
ncbi:fimbrial protein [Raoultella planticola]|jgi:type 1 fimbria pilin|uniref:fimbrial protein n=1 Tax=Raoultella planticola TaxID=575 RepID=UPI001F2B37AE|nr:fimbrial protein [Raoultella planticola]MCE9859993.1 hypothetical protein [Raoultella planticola]